MLRFTLRKTERLKSRKTIDALFEKGNHLAAYPLRMTWLLTNEPIAHNPTSIDVHTELPNNDNAPSTQTPPMPTKAMPPLQFGVTVPKRWFKRANMRNRLKRRMREAYRLQKNDLAQALMAHNKCLAIMCIYTAKQELLYADIAPKMKYLLDKLSKTITLL